MTDPTFPQVRAWDAFDPYDRAIPAVLAGGITTAQVMPGSGNTMGGQGFLIKLRGQSVSDMFIDGSPRILKMAMGENPKRVYGYGSAFPRRTPMSRLGSAWVMRRRLELASKLDLQQRAWCATGGGAGGNGPFPSDLALEPLVALLRGDVRLHIHCYKVLDLETVARLSHEFSFSVAAVHHSLEAWRIPQLLVDNGISVATFADLWGYKFEAYDATVRSPKLLHDAGVRVIIKTDHPVTFAARLMFDAAKAYFYGLDRMAAFAAVTANPAKAAGMFDSVGSIAVGKSADVVVWDRDPLVLGATPARVFVNGEQVVQRDLPFADHPGSLDPPDATLATSGPTACADRPSALYAVVGATVWTMTEATPVPHSNWTVVVRDGFVDCVGAPAACAVPAGADVYAVAGGVVVPGFTATLSHVGQVEIDSEPSTNDGAAEVSAVDVRAVDGIRMWTRHVRSTYRSGVTAAVSQPMGSNILAGQSVAFYTVSNSTDPVRDPAVLISDAVALHANIGNGVKGAGLTASISGQLAQLGRYFEAVPEVPTNEEERALARALNGDIPFVVHVQQMDAIAAVMAFKKRQPPTMKLVIADAVEAHLLADRLAAADISVVLRSRAMPSSFETLRASDSALRTLVAAGVKTVLGVADLDNARNLRWEVGYAVESGLDMGSALAAVTRNVGDVFGISLHDRYGGTSPYGTITKDGPANFVAYDGNPVTLQGRPVAVAVGRTVKCHPKQR